MTKEGLIFRTEEIKAEIKKNLKSIEEILFFLIKENNLERFHISLESRNNKGSTLLIFAVQCGYDIFVKYLLEKGANINAQDFELNTALHYALSHNNFNFADILLKNGANERLMNNNGLTPWQMMTYRDFNN
jgi:ankyrin repeat protein